MKLRVCTKAALAGACVWLAVAGAHEEPAGRQLAKPAQQQAGIRTQLAAPERASVWLPARVQADPRGLLRISAGEAGTIELTEAARPGREVKAGALLGWLTPALSTTAVNDVGAALATATRDAKVGQVQLDRFKIEEAPQFEARLPTPTLQVVTEYRSGKNRAEALAAGLRKPQAINAPRSGQLLRTPAAAGRVVQAGEPLFDLATAAALVVVVEAVDEDFDPAEARVAETAEGRRVALSYIGSGFDAAARSRRAFYAPAADAGLAVNESLRIAQPHGLPAVRVPATAVQRHGDEALVWVHESAEHFEPREVVLAADHDEGEARIVEGLAPGERIVVSGLAALADQAGPGP